MGAHKSRSPDPDAFLAAYASPVRATADEVRAVLRAAVPTFVERVLPGWRAISFRDQQAGHVCALFPHDDHVKLYFEYGASLDDPDGLLEGTTKQTRHVTFRAPSDIRKRALARLARRAVEAQLV